MFNKKGQSIIELLIVMALAALLMPPIFTGFMSARDGKAQQRQRLLATALMKETQEETRNIRERGWSYLAPTGTYHPELSGSSLSLVAGATGVNGFTQQIVVDGVYRDTTGKIVVSPTPGVLDPSTKKISTTISWTTPRASSINHVTYMTRFRDNLPLTETKNTADIQGFLAGTQQSTLVKATTGTFTDDGELTLGAGGSSDWCTPGDPTVIKDLSGQGEAKGVIASAGRAFVGTGQNASSKAFYNISVAIPGSGAPVVTELGTYDPPGGFKTNDTYGQTLGSNYFAYLATDKNNSEVIVLKTNNNIPEKTMEIDLPNNVNANSIFVEGDMLYVTTSDSNLYRYLLSSDRTSANAKGSITLKINGNQVVGKKIYVVNSYVFIAVDSTSYQFKIIDGTDQVTLKDITNGQIQLSDKVGVGVFARSDSNRAYVVTALSTTSGKSEFFIVDTTNKGSLSIKAQYDTVANGDMDPKAVTLVTGNKAIIVGYGGDQYIAFTNIDQDKLDYCGKITVPGLKINGVSAIVESSRTFSYIITEDTAKELQMIEGGPGGSFATEGTFISQAHQFTFPTAFNRFTAHINQPISTSTVEIQVSNNDCINPYVFIGPDPLNPLTSTFKTSATGATTIDGIVPFDSPVSGYQNPNRCFKYKALLKTTDPNQSPTLYDITFNYSP
ncbi:MAG: hypothetical protein UR23_C0003G0009 [Candidatus Roizmanbacteria bacterium GW2011_GWA2_32_13]|uniref:Uncharacterized protein n=1 Tax=Candidatus Roizmanbacteria bacterium GW2011_GWA2_32_13 TaxID=1618475 RepID=A0A0F9Z107_9BACT|nr:MAG: hypothetical protein UR23_C0003G0009 [Candidatus Roizmanbacteria bacterium GW2011_GWA2_32_13]